MPFKSGVISSSFILSFLETLSPNSALKILLATSRARRLLCRARRREFLRLPSLFGAMRQCAAEFLHRTPIFAGVFHQGRPALWRCRKTGVATAGQWLDAMMP